MKLTTISLILIFAGEALAERRGSLLQQVPAKYGTLQNPLADSLQATRAGAKLFDRECSACHGQMGVGTRKAPALKIGNTSASYPGAVFWVLRNGSLRRGMPSFAHMPEPQRWQIIMYLQELQSTSAKAKTVSTITDVPPL